MCCSSTYGWEFENAFTSMKIVYKPRWNIESVSIAALGLMTVQICNLSTFHRHKYYWEVCNTYTHESGIHKVSPIVQCTIGVCNEEQEHYASKRVWGCAPCNRCSHLRYACSQGHLSLCLFLIAMLLSSAKTASSTPGHLLIMPNI